MKSKQEIKEWLLANCVNEEGNLDLSYLDLTDFEGDVMIRNLKVKQNLFQDGQIVGWHLFQAHQKVKRDLFQYKQEVKGDLFQDNKEEEK